MITDSDPKTQYQLKTVKKLFAIEVQIWTFKKRDIFKISSLPIFLSSFNTRVSKS